MVMNQIKQSAASILSDVKKQIKLDWKELEKHVKQNPESKFSALSENFGVNQTAIFYPTFGTSRM